MTGSEHNLYPMRLLALGDSYTIGTAAPAGARWPVQLAGLLRDQGMQARDPEIIARNGWTTADLMQGLEAAEPQGPYQLVTLLIGVNNHYQARPLDEYQAEFHALLATAIDLAGQDPSRVLVLSIPDWSVTPFALPRDRERVRREIDSFNAVNRQETESAGAGYLNITPLSRRAADEPGLLAEDELHPSGEMYAAWAELALPSALSALGVDR